MEYRMGAKEKKRVGETREDHGSASVEMGSGSLSEYVYSYLADKIIRGIIRYGEKLNIKQLASEMNVSTMPVRDALKQLAAEQLVIIKPRSSCVVRTPRKAEVLESLEARRMIELHVARTIYSHVKDEEIYILKEIVYSMAKTLPTGKESPEKLRAKKLQYIELDREFHTAFCNLANNSFITKFYREVNMNLSMSFRYEVGLEYSTFNTLDVHRSIVNYLEMHSADVVGLLETHLSLSYHHIINGWLFKKLPD
jgi:DNA-binding GntR family transcriptional regulator